MKTSTRRRRTDQERKRRNREAREQEKRDKEQASRDDPNGVTTPTLGAAFGPGHSGDSSAAESGGDDEAVIAESTSENLEVLRDTGVDLRIGTIADWRYDYPSGEEEDDYTRRGRTVLGKPVAPSPGSDAPVRFVTDDPHVAAERQEMSDLRGFVEMLKSKLRSSSTGCAAIKALKSTLDLEPGAIKKTIRYTQFAKDFLF